ncbi:MAG: peptide deformylase [Holosporales bacterium]|jgi:peptide deformylase|nr:peptide deformylase [Holosporales bacterium]
MKWAQVLVCCLLAEGEVVGMKVCVYPAPVLSEEAQPVTEVSEDIRDILEQMKDIMLQEDGIGIAAPQVGISKRLIVVHNKAIQEAVIEASGGEKGIAGDCLIGPTFYKMVNPKIIKCSDDWALSKEGCLSLPKVYREVKRFTSVSVEFLDEQGKKQTVEATGLLAFCFQHEIDHLGGKLFIDRLEDSERKQALAEYNNPTANKPTAP